MTFFTALRWSLVLLIAWMYGAPAGQVHAAGQDVGTEAQRESGRRLYHTYCSQCHGDNGDGVADATPFLSPRPRDFTTGRYKVRTTPSGTLPTHQDLVNIIRRGMPYTSMPGWPSLSNRELADLAYFITTFSPDFSNAANVPQPVPLPSAPRATAESIELGKRLYEEMDCAQCHGSLGRGDGPSAPTLTDDWGHPIRAADLSQPWTFRGGSSREDVFRTMRTGFNGTPMPSFVDAMTDEQQWAMTDFIVSLSGSREPGYSTVVIARHVLESIDLEQGAAIFESAPVARFPIVGQIVEPGRSFHPRTTSVTVQAVYDAESIAFLVRWHDMSAQRTGTNGPSLPVPLEEETAAGPGESIRGEEEPGTSIWGDEEAAPPPAGQEPGASIWGEDEVAQPPTGQEPGVSIWDDEQPEPAAAVSEFSDAVAIQFPAQVPTGARKPYFIFGDAQNPVDLWFFDLADTEPFQFTGRGSAEIAPNDTGDLTGVASYADGEWSVIFKRPLRPTLGAPFVPGTFMPVAFSVWDGLSRERGNRRGLTGWYSLYVEPEVVTSAVGPMVQTALLILAIELAVIGWVRRRHGTRASAELGGEPSQPAATTS